MAGVYSFGRGLFRRTDLPGSGTTYSWLHRLRTDQIVMSQLKAWEGAVARVAPAFAGAHLSPQFPTFSMDLDRVAPAYVEWYCRSPATWERLRAKSRGMGARRDSVSPASFVDLPLPLPPLDEQQRLVGLLDQISAKASKARQLAADLQAPQQSPVLAYLDRLFGDPYSGRAGTLKVEEWVPLADLVTDVADGPHQTPAYSDEGIPFVTALNVAPGVLTMTPIKYVSLEQHRALQRRARAERGDVLVTKDGTIGLCCLVETDREFSFFVSVALIKPLPERLDGQFLVWLLRAPSTQQRISDQARGDMIKHLVLREIRGLLCPVIPLLQQREIVARIAPLESRHTATRDRRRNVVGALDMLVPKVLDRLLEVG
jgi:type I restriction enzyme, S subunit